MFRGWKMTKKVMKKGDVGKILAATMVATILAIAASPAIVNGYWPGPSYCISGYKLNGTGNGLAGWTIFIDANGNQILDAGERNTTTGADGYWEICGLAPDEYVVAEVLEAGWKLLVPTEGNYTFTLEGCDKTGLNFTNVPRLQLACISGYKLSDRTGEGLAGWTINVYNSSTGELAGSAVTDSRGFWQVCNLTPGNYDICEELQAGWTTIAPSSGCYNDTPVGGVLGDVTSKNFTNSDEACISGYKVNEMGDGLAGWTIFIDANGNHRLDAGERNTTTDVDGYWEICGLAPGEYVVAEVLEAGWKLLAPAMVTTPSRSVAMTSPGSTSPIRKRKCPAPVRPVTGRTIQRHGQ